MEAGIEIQRSQLVVARGAGGFGRGSLAAKIAIEPRVSSFTCSKRCLKDLAEAVLGVAMVVEGAPPVVGLENAAG
jgi:hypothetical protein